MLYKTENWGKMAFFKSQTFQLAFTVTSELPELGWQNLNRAISTCSECLLSLSNPQCLRYFFVWLITLRYCNLSLIQCAKLPHAFSMHACMRTTSITNTRSQNLCLNINVNLRWSVRQVSLVNPYHRKLHYDGNRYEIFGPFQKSETIHEDWEFHES